MDLRNLPECMEASERISERRRRIEKELGADLNLLTIDAPRIGSADERNCEQMFGAVPIPVGLAGPLLIHFSSGESANVYLPIATTEGALVASVNRGCKALTQAGGVRVRSVYRGMTRSMAFAVESARLPDGQGKCLPAGQAGKVESESIRKLEKEWKTAAESTSSHLKVLSFEIDCKNDCLFLTIVCDTDEAMGMNMVTIAAQAAGEFLSKTLDIPLLTIAANIDSDKKPSRRTKEKGRGHSVEAEATLSEAVIRDVLKAEPEALRKTAHAKLEIGSDIAGALGKNLHAANIIAALYIATGQDAAHVVEGSLADTYVEPVGQERSCPTGSLLFSAKIPAILVGVRGGGTELPAQKQCLNLLLKHQISLPRKTQLAETIGAAVLAGEISLLAAQATHTLAKAHQGHARNDSL